MNRYDLTCVQHRQPILLIHYTFFEDCLISVSQASQTISLCTFSDNVLISRLFIDESHVCVLNSSHFELLRFPPTSPWWALWSPSHWFISNRSHVPSCAATLSISPRGTEIVLLAPMHFLTDARLKLSSRSYWWLRCFGQRWGLPAFGYFDVCFDPHFTGPSLCWL